MRVSRFFLDQPLTVNQQITLDKETTHYMQNVLRLKLHTKVSLFNGQGGEYLAEITELSKKSVVLTLLQCHPSESESPLETMLLQAISRPEHMDYALQKATELGVKQIYPILTKRSPPLAIDRQTKRQQHWQKIIRSACEQCGRNRLPLLHPVLSLEEALSAIDSNALRLLLDPLATRRFIELEHTQQQAIACLIGAEGGLSEDEISFAQQQGYLGVQLGKRILRTETAASTLLALAQMRWGDF